MSRLIDPREQHARPRPQPRPQRDYITVRMPPDFDQEELVMKHWQVVQMREDGHTWQEIGRVLGVSRQRAHQIGTSA